MKPLLRICAWCNREIGHDGAAVGERLTGSLQESWEQMLAGKSVTHGMCKSCEQAELRKLLPENAKIAE
jgi:hypothetical protein